MMVIYVDNQIYLCGMFYIWFYLYLCLAYNVYNSTRGGILTVPLCMYSIDYFFERIFYEIQVIVDAICLIHLFICLLIKLSCLNFRDLPRCNRLSNLKFKLLFFLCVCLLIKMTNSG